MAGGVSGPETRGRAVILMYHRLSQTPFEPAEGDYVVPAEAFARQMDLLATGGGRVVSLRDLQGGPCPERSVALTFDDGCDTDVSAALPILRERGFTAAFFVNPARLGRDGYLSWRQLAELAAAGMVVGSHGLDHRLLDGLGADELREQLAGSRHALEQGLGAPVDTLSLPGGSGGAPAVQAARDAGYRVVLGSAPGVVQPPALPPVLPRYAIRRSWGFEQFRALVDQRLSVRAAQAQRDRGTRLARAALGAGRYERLRREWLTRS